MNYVRNNAMKHCIFKEPCNEMGSEFEVLLCWFNIWRVSWGKVLNCFCLVCKINPVFARVPTSPHGLL